MSWLVKGALLALGFLAGLWLSSPDVLRGFGGWAARWADEIQKWESSRDARLAKMIASELRGNP